MLDQLNQRLSRYLPRPVHARIQRQPEKLCTLERRWLTVAFVDVVGFTELAERLVREHTLNLAAHVEQNVDYLE